jgi:glycosyltransferase involved in cell wall biosynthesis
MLLHKSRKIAFITPYPYNRAPGQRFRFEQYLPALQQKEYTIHYFSFLSANAYANFYRQGYTLYKLMCIAVGFLKRIKHLFYILNTEYVFVFREAAPLGPPFIEWVIAKILQKKIIYDFDDAIWLTDNIKESFIERKIRWRTKVGSICKWSYRISCGNEYLCAFARKYNSSVTYLPTTIDTEGLHKPKTIKKTIKNKVTIGWTGSHSTLKYLKFIEPTLTKLENEYPQIEILIIANHKPNLNLNSFKFLPWQLETEAEDLAKIDIGIMPLPDDEWTKGKCGFKALQYMALQIPTVASPVGVNTSIIDHGVNGFLASDQNGWLIQLERLILDKELREKIGTEGRKKVIANYSVVSNTSIFLSLFDSDKISHRAVNKNGNSGIL